MEELSKFIRFKLGCERRSSDHLDKVYRCAKLLDGGRRIVASQRCGRPRIDVRIILVKIRWNRGGLGTMRRGWGARR